MFELHFCTQMISIQWLVYNANVMQLSINQLLIKLYNCY